MGQWEKFDLYHCPTVGPHDAPRYRVRAVGAHTGTLIARFGDATSEYASVPVGFREQGRGVQSCLEVAYRRHKTKNR